MTIYMMWYQGFDAAPELVQRLSALWQQLNPQETFHFVGGEEADDLIADAGIDPSSLTMQVRANIVRVSLLAAHGGVWTDATLLPSASLQSWLPEPLSKTGYFCFSNDHRDRLISNWFLAAEAGNPLMSQWKERYCAYFRTPRKLNKTGPRHIRLMQDLRAYLAPSSFGRPEIAARSRYYPYFIQHYLFAHLVETDHSCGEIWRQVPKLSGGPAGRLKAACNRHSGTLASAELERLYYAFPVHKLNWRKAGLFESALALAEGRVASAEARTP